MSVTIVNSCKCGGKVVSQYGERDRHRKCNCRWPEAPGVRASCDYVQRVVRKPILSGDGSVSLWNDINGAKTVAQLRRALYHLGCKCQELESEVARLSNEKLNHI